MGSARVADVSKGDGSARPPSVFAFWTRVVERWEELQVGRQGSYSIERLVSLDHYCKTASRTRVILVCVLTPVPAFTFAVLLECLPLKHPTEGWAANWLFWIRWTLTMLAISFVGVSQLITYVPGLNFTLLKRVVVSVGSTSTFVGLCLLGATAMKFPVPYMLQLGSVVMGLCIATMVRLVFSRKEFAKDSPLRPYLKRFYRFLFAYLVLGGVYPFYRVVFDFAPVSFRGVVILLLPMWKFAAKHFIVKAIRELEDFIPELVALTVDFFSALFVSACMTTSGSVYLSAMFIVGDVGQSLLEFNEVRGNAKTLMHLLRSRRESQARSQKKKDRRTKSTSEDVDLMNMILYVARHPGTFEVTSLRPARMWACLPHSLSPHEHEQLLALEASGAYGMDERITSRWINQPPQHPEPHLNSIAIVPVTSGVVTSFPPGSEFIGNESSSPARVSSNKFRHADRSKKLVLQGLQLLFHCEYLALVEYVECVVPLVFVTYKSILEQLPNVVYYPGGAGNWNVSAVTNLLVFAALEIMTFVLFVQFLQRKFSFSPLYQLAFVFETQAYLVQAKLLIEIVTLLQSKLAHFGGGYAANIDHKT